MVQMLAAWPLFAQTAETLATGDSGARGESPVQLEPPPQSVPEAIDTVYGSLTELWRDFLRRLPLIFVGVMILFVTWFLARVGAGLARRATRRMRLRTSLQELFGQIAQIGIWFTGIIVAAVIVFPGMTPAKILTVLGLGSIAIGFAFKDIVENFFAGVLILWRFPFEAGDYVHCGSIEGKVEQTTIRMTMIRQVDGQLVVMPNAQLFKSPVRVSTSRPVRRITITVGVGYGEDVDRAREIVTASVANCSSVSNDRPVEVFAREFAGSSVNFEVSWWTGSTPLDERKSRDEVVTAVKRALDEAGIEIPFPYRTLTFKAPIELARSHQHDGDMSRSEPNPN